jgi:hypothetical protein
MASQIVLLSCGHWFRETTDGELPPDEVQRACGHPEHYPRTYPSVALPDLEQHQLRSLIPRHFRDKEPS